jgi:putative transposase
MTPQPPTESLCYIDYYSKCYSKSPVLAREFILDLIVHKNFNVSKVAKICGISRPTVYLALSKFKSGNLGNLSTKPKSHPRQVSSDLESEIVRIRSETNYGPIRINLELQRLGFDKIHQNTINRVIKRNNLPKSKRKRSANQELRNYYLSPLRFWEVDTKEITDLHALPKEVYDHILDKKLPIYQFTAIDTFTRIRLLGYAHNNTFTNAWTFIHYLISNLRLCGYTDDIVVQTDNGSEYGGWTTEKLIDLNQDLKPFNTTLIHIPKAQKQKQGHVERSHRTDDEELYIPYLTSVDNTKDFLVLTQKWLWYYNNKRNHQGKYLKLRTPYQYAKDLQEYGQERTKSILHLDGTIEEQREKVYLPKSVNLDKLINIPILLFDNISVGITMEITKLIAQSNIQNQKTLKEGQSVKEVCGDYLLC